MFVLLDAQGIKHSDSKTTNQPQTHRIQQCTTLRFQRKCVLVCVKQPTTVASRAKIAQHSCVSVHNSHQHKQRRRRRQISHSLRIFVSRGAARAPEDQLCIAKMTGLNCATPTACFAEQLRLVFNRYVEIGRVVRIFRGPRR
jgi:hypothetical protein